METNKALYFINGRWYQIADSYFGHTHYNWLYHKSMFVFPYSCGAFSCLKFKAHRKFTDLKDICNYLNEIGITDYPAAYTPHVHQIYSTTDVVKFVDMSYLRLHNGKD